MDDHEQDADSEAITTDIDIPEEQAVYGYVKRGNHHDYPLVRGM